jgi:cysteine desulfurase
MAVKLPIFMDSHSTTPTDPRVLEAMLPYFTEKFGHPGSRNHPFGWEAEAGMERAREQLARLIGARDPKEIVFTSGGTESDNLALKGVAEMYQEKGDHIVTTVIEHRAVLDTCRRLEKRGVRVTQVPVGPDGIVDVEQVRRAVTDRTILISVMLASNEIGTIQPIAEIGKLAKERGIIFHTDAVQAVGKIPVDVEKMGVDLLTCSAHKMYGPKGIGALYVRRKAPRVRIAPMIDGGGHERGTRSGTVPVPLAVGFGRAAEICGEVMVEEGVRLAALRDRLQDRILSTVDETYLNGHPERRLPQNLNISFAYVEGESVLMGLNREVGLSSGSACTSATLEPSYVIAALGVGADLAHSSIRFGLHRFTTDEEVEFVANRTIEVVRRLRDMSPLYELAKEGVDIKSIHRHRQRAQAAAGQDPLLGAGGGRHQGGHPGLPGEVGQARGVDGGGILVTEPRRE